MLSRRLLALVCACALGACGGDDDSSPAPSHEADGGAGGEAALPQPDDCRDGCALTLTASCDNGPSSQATCERDCRMLAAGACGGEYQALQVCARSKAVECSAQGQPIVPDCSDLQAAFLACLPTN